MGIRGDDDEKGCLTGVIGDDLESQNVKKQCYNHNLGHHGPKKNVLLLQEVFETLQARKFLLFRRSSQLHAEGEDIRTGILSVSHRLYRPRDFFCLQESC